MTMHHYPASIRTLIRNFARLPGIGEKSAERLALHLLTAPESEARELARGIGELRQKIRLCTQCFSLSDADLCRLCSDPTRDATILCVVEAPADMVAVEKSGAFTGLYHILQGLLSPMDGIGPDDIRIAELMTRVAKNGAREVIIATGTSMEGEATAAYLAERLAGCGVCVTRIASGVPVGGDLKYVDQVTLKKAMDARHAI
jgi:recombination protein RecR